MPGRGKPLHLQSVSDLWSGIIGTSTFCGLFLGVVLVCTLVGTQKGGQSFWPVLVVGGFLGVCAIAVSAVCLGELVRRRAWVPAGAARFPVLMSIVLSVVLMAVGVALDFVGIGIALLLKPVSSPALIGASVSGLGFAVIGLVYLIRRLARKPPTSEGAGATELSPAERPPDKPVRA
jgi:hypothetical protein